MNDDHDDDFDRGLRALHARAVEQVPPRTLHQLRVRRANTAGAAPARRSRAAAGAWWLAAAATTAVFALAIGLGSTGLGPTGPEPAPPVGEAPALAAIAESAQAASYEEGLAALEEDPDLYLWLAAQDSQMLAME